VTPTHVVPQILTALIYAVERGLNLPLVYNCSGYETIATLALLDGVIDIYMPDFKFWNAQSVDPYAHAPDYRQKATAAIQEMYRQVGDLILDRKGLARRGLLLRHLVMPGALDETKEILYFISRNISANTYVNIMDQYRPCGRAADFPPIDKPLSAEEYQQALEIAEEAGITRLDKKSFPDLLQYLYMHRGR
jgi:putative pyruvate formate lyase activating enzyme